MELKYVTTRAPTTHLCHYSSKYYDPVKAHEYYENHKQLSGKKTSTNKTSKKSKKEKKSVEERIKEKFVDLNAKKNK